MPATETVVLFMAAALAVNMTPGPSIAYVMSRSFGQGRTAGLVSALGLGTGSLLHAIAATLGLSAIVAYSPMVYAVIRYLGAAYLVYLGVDLLRRRQVRIADDGPTGLPLSGVYWQGVLTEILNPKIALFFLSFLPQFVDPARGSVAGQTLFFGLVFSERAAVVKGTTPLGFDCARAPQASNNTFYRTAGSHSLPAAGQPER